MTLATELNRTNRKIFRRLYFKRRSATGVYESWTEISTRRIISYGVIDMHYEVAHNFISQGGFSIKLQNVDGFFNSPDDPHSYWYRSISQIRTLIKIVAGYIDESGVEQPSAGNVFVGFINSMLQYTDTEVVIRADSLLDIFKQYEAENLPGIYSPAVDTFISLSDLVNRIANHTDGSSNYIFRQFFSLSAWRCEASNNYFKHNSYARYGIPSETVSDLTLYDFIENMARTEDSLMFIDNHGNFVIKRRKNVIGIYNETNTNTKPDLLFMHARFNDSVISGKGPDWIWTNTATYESVKFNNGVRVSADENELSVTSAYVFCTTSTLKTSAAFDADHFTIEFWAKPRFNLTTGGIINVLDNGSPVVNAPNWLNLATNGVQNTDAFFIRWVHDGILGNLLRMEKHGANNTFASIQANTNTLWWETNSTVFLAFVHDNYGINGTDDKFRIYCASDGGSITLISSVTGTSCSIRPLTNVALYLGGPYGTEMYPALTRFDNLKIYNYAKTDFSDRESEMAYRDQTGFALKGCCEDNRDVISNVVGDVRKITSVDNVYNNIKIKYIDLDTSTSFANAKETWSIGDGSSSDLYGVREYRQDNFYLNTTTAVERVSALLEEFKDPKIQIEIKTTLIPELNPESLIKFHHRSNGKNMSDPFDAGFSDGFGDMARSIDLNGVNFKIKKVKHDLDKLTSAFTLEEYNG